MKAKEQESILAPNLKRILDERGMKLKRAAEKCGYPEKAFSDLLNGRRIVRDRDVFIISQRLNIPYRSLLEPNDI